MLLLIGGPNTENDWNSREIISKITSFNQDIAKDHLPHINPEHIKLEVLISNQIIQ